MLKELKINNYVLIDSLDIVFPEGLVIITGQTGAGKSILLGALSMVLGSKCDASAIGQNADNCVVEAEFEVSSDEYILTCLEENDVEWNDGSLTVRRVISKSGRSRSFINDCPVNVQVLQKISSNLVDIHSQHQTLLLNDSHYQLALLDAYASNTVLLERCSSLFSEMERLRSELAVLDSKIKSAEREKDYNQAVYSQLMSAHLKDGELEDLEEEHARLANAEEIKESLCAFAGIADGPEDMDLSMVNSLKEMQRLLQKTSRFIPSLEPLSERLESCRIELEDILGETSSMNEAMEDSNERLEQVEDRMSQLYGLLKKHACSDVAELIALRDELSLSISGSESLRERMEDLSDSLKQAEMQFNAVCVEISDKRKAASEPFSHLVTKSIRDLELPHALFEVSVLPSAPGRNGSDTVAFLFSASGSRLTDVSKCVSGGEMSRIMLCLKYMMAQFRKMPTMVFDEIDTGVSGSVADKMGSMICSMGTHMQVFAITHLPQVAAKGEAHYLVSKSEDETGANVSTSITRLTPEERVMELARMLSGSKLTQAAIDNAKSLLQ